MQENKTDQERVYLQNISLFTKLHTGGLCYSQPNRHCIRQIARKRQWFIYYTSTNITLDVVSCLKSIVSTFPELAQYPSQMTGSHCIGSIPFDTTNFKINTLRIYSA